MTTRTGQKWAAIQPIRRDIYEDERARGPYLWTCQVMIEERAEVEGVELDPETWELIMPARIITEDGDVLEFQSDLEPPMGACLRVEGVGR